MLNQYVNIDTLTVCVMSGKIPANVITVDIVILCTLRLKIGLQLKEIFQAAEGLTTDEDRRSAGIRNTDTMIKEAIVGEAKIRRIKRRFYNIINNSDNKCTIIHLIRNNISNIKLRNILIGIKHQNLGVYPGRLKFSPSFNRRSSFHQMAVHRKVGYD